VFPPSVLLSSRIFGCLAAAPVVFSANCFVVVRCSRSVRAELSRSVDAIEQRVIASGFSGRSIDLSVRSCLKKEVSRRPRTRGLFSAVARNCPSD
jgi:hypothetical protein